MHYAIVTTNHGFTLILSSPNPSNIQKAARTIDAMQIQDASNAPNLDLTQLPDDVGVQWKP